MDPEGVRIVEWPAERDVLAQLARSGIPRLVVVARGSDPPEGADCCQDWMWRTGDERELRLRLRQLALRALEHGHARPYLDSLGLLHVGLRSVHLPPKEQALIRILMARFNQGVPREMLVRAGWPEGIKRPNILANRISTLRARIAWVGLEIVGSAATGFSLRVKNSELTDEDAGGFEDEFDARRWVSGGLTVNGENSSVT